MKIEMVRHVSGHGFDNVRFESTISGRDVGICVPVAMINQLAEVFKHTDSVGHAAWHLDNPQHAVPCPACKKERS